MQRWGFNRQGISFSRFGLVDTQDTWFLSFDAIQFDAERTRIVVSPLFNRSSVQDLPRDTGGRANESANLGSCHAPLRGRLRQLLRRIGSWLLLRLRGVGRHSHEGEYRHRR